MSSAQIPMPIAFSMLGAIAGFIFGGFNQCFPIWVGALTGCSTGCVLSVLLPLPVSEPPISEQIIVQNIYVLYGMPKD